jgi:hypothetical protein
MVSMAYYPFLNTRKKHRQSLKIDKSSKEGYVKSLGAITEAIFYVLLIVYQNSLQVRYEYNHRAIGIGKDDQRTLMWFATMEPAEKALKTAVEAAFTHASMGVDQADKLAQKASEALNERLAVIFPNLLRNVS